MKKTLFVMLAAVSSVAFATDFVSGDFTSPEFSTLGTQQNADGVLGGTSWETHKFGSKNSILVFSADGLTVNQNSGNYADWAKTVLYTELTTPVTYEPSVPYTIAFDLTGGNGQRAFALASDTYSVVIGIAYDGSLCVASMESDFFSAYNTVTGHDDLPGGGDGAVSLSSCQLVLTGNQLAVTLGDFTGTYTLADNYTFTKAGFSVDGNATVTTKGLSITPEPATATLSLLALAGLAARRRRH